jgi:hypothetical protein
MCQHHRHPGRSFPQAPAQGYENHPTRPLNDERCFCTIMYRFRIHVEARSYLKTNFRIPPSDSKCHAFRIPHLIRINHLAFLDSNATRVHIAASSVRNGHTLRRSGRWRDILAPGVSSRLSSNLKQASWLVAGLCLEQRSILVAAHRHHPRDIRLSYFDSVRGC